MTGAPRWQSGDPGRSRVRDVAGLIATRSICGVLTIALILFVRQFSRNVPFMDDFNMVPVMTETVPVTLESAWSQHHEHRPMISRLILAGLSRFVANDFRAPRYANAALPTPLENGGRCGPVAPGDDTEDVTAAQGERIARGHGFDRRIGVPEHGVDSASADVLMQSAALAGTSRPWSSIAMVEKWPHPFDEIDR